MLSKALREFFSGPLHQVLVNLGGEDGEKWEKMLNKFNRKELCWVPEIEEYFRQPLQVFYLTVPGNYIHSSRLGTFRKSLLGSFLRFDDDLNDDDARATHQLKAGKTYTVKLIPLRKQIDLKDAINYLRSKDAVLAGAQGLSLVYELKRNRLVSVGPGPTVSLNDLQDLPNGPQAGYVGSGKKWPLMYCSDRGEDHFSYSRGDGDVLQEEVLVCFFDEEYSYQDDHDRDDA